LHSNRVARVNADGRIQLIAGTGLPALGLDGPDATRSGMSRPVHLAFDGANTLYVVEQGNHRIRRITPAGAISTVAGNGVPGFSGDGGPAVAATLAGEVTLLFATMPSAMQHVKSGRLAALAVTSEKRSPAAPEVPTMAEAGVKGFDVSENWVGALVPRGTPGPIVDRLQKAIARSADDPEVRARLSAAGYEVVAGTSAEMRQAITRQARSWAQVIKAANIQAD
jgi:hypothetical protein